MLAVKALRTAVHCMSAFPPLDRAYKHTHLYCYVTAITKTSHEIKALNSQANLELLMRFIAGIQQQSR